MSGKCLKRIILGNIIVFIVYLVAVFLIFDLGRIAFAINVIVLLGIQSLINALCILKYILDMGADKDGKKD